MLFRFLFAINSVCLFRLLLMFLSAEPSDDPLLPRSSSAEGSDGLLSPRRRPAEFSDDLLLSRSSSAEGSDDPLLPCSSTAEGSEAALSLRSSVAERAESLLLPRSTYGRRRSRVFMIRLWVHILILLLIENACGWRGWLPQSCRGYGRAPKLFTSQPTFGRR